MQTIKCILLTICCSKKVSMYFKLENGNAENGNAENANMVCCFIYSLFITLNIQMTMMFFSQIQLILFSCNSEKSVSGIQYCLSWLRLPGCYCDSEILFSRNRISRPMKNSKKLFGPWIKSVNFHYVKLNHV